MNTVNSEWMRGKRGLMVHYLLPEMWDEEGRKFDDINEGAEQFQLDRFMTDFDSTGSEWLIFTFGQNSGYYCSPNPVIDKYAGEGHCSERDIMMEIAQELKRRGKKLIAYLPCEINANTSMHTGFLWNTEPGSAQIEFQKRYLEAITFWAEKFGDLFAGWWFDGCYPWDAFNNKFMLWNEWFHAARAGNPNALVTFNDGCFCTDYTVPIRPDFDYFAGEATALYDSGPQLANELKKFVPASEFIPGTQCRWQCLVSIDALWKHRAQLGDWLPPEHRFIDSSTLELGEMEPPIYTADELNKLIDSFCSLGGAVTLNAGIFLNGGLGSKTVALLKELTVRNQ